jgi:hypothetical protein
MDLLEPITEAFQPLTLLLGTGLAIITLALGTWVFRMRRH